MKQEVKNSTDELMDNEPFALYPYLQKYTMMVKIPERQIVGREKEIRSIMAAFCRPELCNVILLAEAGTGKTALVQGAMLADKNRQYLEVDLSKMISDVKNSENEMASIIKTLFQEVESYCKMNAHELVLFIDEFHQIVQLSSAAVEVLKPLLADSGTRGIRVVAATTYDEFREHISGNQPLVERLQRINLQQPNKVLTVQILKDMATKYGVDKHFYNDSLYELIYDYTNRYIPASSQPRKALKVLDSMVGWHKLDGRPLDAHLLADVIYDSEGVNIAFRVDASTIKEELDAHVFAQDFATRAVEGRLNICVAGINNDTKPMSSFLFTGSTGVGKTEMAKQLSRILFENERNLIRFDMTEFAREDSLDRFRDELTTRVWERPYSVILFDEIEKAHPSVTRILIPLLDDGRLTDRNGRVVSFINAYIIMTTNAGSEIYRTISEYNPDNDGSGEKMLKYMKLIRRSISETTGGGGFPPELLGRIDVVVPFQPLSEKTLKTIVQTKLEKLRQDIMAKHNKIMTIDNRVVTYIIGDKLDTTSDAGGARRAMSTLESDVTTTVAKFINNNPDVLEFGIYIKGEMVSENKSIRESDAYVAVNIISRQGNPLTNY